MHILKIIHGYPPNYNAGSEVYSQSICNELSKNNKVSVFTREENPYGHDGFFRHIDNQGKFINNKMYIDLGVFHKNYATAKDEKGWFHIDKLGLPLY